jgi:Cap4 dsDNA endonuclease
MESHRRAKLLHLWTVYSYSMYAALALSPSSRATLIPPWCGADGCGTPKRLGKTDRGPSRVNLIENGRAQSGGSKTKTMDTIHDKAPRETVGRDTMVRFRMQYQAAAFAALEILSGKEVDRIYCDYHDDFVVRRAVAGVVEYHFFQVKTKGRANQQWDVDGVFSLKRTGALDTPEKLEAIRSSIAGKLFVHTVEFGEQCRAVTVLSNVHFKDEVHDLVADLAAGTSSKKYTRQLIEKFAAIISPDKPLSPEQVEAARKKLTLQPNVQYIGDTLEAFGIAAHNAIWKHSEIALHQHEVERIARSLVTLVEERSCASINGLSKADIDLATGVGLEDLLRVLSISTQVYQTLQQGGDPEAIKTASILQRKLKEAGTPDPMIESASRAKVAWDVWMRNARHTFPDFKLDVLLAEIDGKCRAWLLGGGVLADLEKCITELQESSIGKQFPKLDVDLLFGALCAAIVRRAAR